MKLEGLHILLTYQCTYECDHCFVWGSPRQTGTLTLEQIENILLQAKDAGVASIYFEGGNPFCIMQCWRRRFTGRPTWVFQWGSSRMPTGQPPSRTRRNGCVHSWDGWPI